MSETLDIDARYDFEATFDGDAVKIDGGHETYVHYLTPDDISEILTTLREIDGQVQSTHYTSTGLTYVPAGKTDGSKATLDIEACDSVEWDGYTIPEDDLQRVREAVQELQKREQCVKFSDGVNDVVLPLSSDFNVRNESSPTVYYDDKDAVGNSFGWLSQNYCENFDSGLHFVPSKTEIVMRNVE
jgi:hypothetical protein